MIWGMEITQKTANKFRVIKRFSNLEHKAVKTSV